MVSGADRVYRIAVPANQVLEAFLESTNEQYATPKLWLATDCPDIQNTCQQIQRLDLLWHNGADEARIVYLIVDGWYPDDEGTFRLTTNLFDATDLEEGDTCEEPIVLSGSGTYMGDTSNRRNIYGGHGGACKRQGGFWGYSTGADEVS